MYQPKYEYGMPQNTRVTYTTPNNGERFFFAPFLVGGLAGTALGYGIANNNFMNNQRPCCMPPQPIYYYPNQYPTTYYNNFY